MASEKAIWNAARVTYLNVNSIMEGCDDKWDAELRVRGQRWFDIAKSTLDAAAAVDGDAQWNEAIEAACTEQKRRPQADARIKED